MTQTKVIEPERKLPDIALPKAPHGEPHQVLVGRRKATVVVFLHDTECSGCLQYAEQIAAAYPTLQEWDGEVALVAHSMEAASQLAARGEWPFPVLADAERRLSDALGLAPPAVLIADRWGEIHFSQAAKEAHGLADAKELAEWLRFLAVQCSP